MNLHSHYRAVRALLALFSALAAAYLWAVVFGKGLHGLTLGADLGETFPDANAAFIAAVLLYVGGPAVASHLRMDVEPSRLYAWLASTAAIGGVLFAISLLFA